MLKKFEGEDAYEKFGEWIDDVNLEHGEIDIILINYEPRPKSI